MHPNCCTVFIATTLITATMSSGAVSYLTQDRSVVAVAGFGSGPSQTLTAPDFQTFNQTATISDPVNMGGGATATQSSSLEQSHISNGTELSAFDGRQSSRGTARSLFATTFTVDVPTPWSISGSWMFSLFNAPTAATARGTLIVSLEQQGGEALYALNYDSWQMPMNPPILNGVFAGSGMLQPGQTYAFTLNMTETVQIISATSSGTGSFSATLSFVPAPSAAALLGLGGLIAGRRRRV